MWFLELGRAMINSDSRSIFQELAEEGKKLHRARISECKSKSKEIEREPVSQYPKEEEGPEDKTDFSELSSPRHLCPHVHKQVLVTPSRSRRSSIRSHSRCWDARGLHANDDHGRIRVTNLLIPLKSCTVASGV
jgi:hypothetical protein